MVLDDNDQFLALVILFFSPNLILFDFRRLLLPSLRKSSAKKTLDSLNRFFTNVAPGKNLSCVE